MRDLFDHLLGKRFVINVPKADETAHGKSFRNLALHARRLRSVVRTGMDQAGVETPDQGRGRRPSERGPQPDIRDLALQIGGGPTLRHHAKLQLAWCPSLFLCHRWYPVVVCRSEEQLGAQRGKEK
ncbi:hypothetical protein [Mameliella sp.]|uniref:hypothetical protein n=1 Tax=Mameliella sp. TaxID=1924940 RepID=UPI003BAB7874